MTRTTALDHPPRGPRMPRIAGAVTALLTAAALAGCGGGQARTGDAAGRPSARPASPTSAAAPAAALTSAVLSRVPDGRAARTRLGYADLERLRTADLPLPAATVAGSVLGDARGDAQVVVGRDRRPAPTDTSAAASAITGNAVSAVQSCLGDAIAQTIVGPGTMGTDGAAGAGLAVSEVDEPTGVQLRVCSAAHFRRGVHRAEDAFERAFGDLPGTKVAETEIGEREIMTATVRAAAVPRAQLRAILAGGRALRTLAPAR